MFPDNKYGRFSVTSDGSLIISPVKKEDAGFYVCSALSVVGSSTAKAYLNVSSSSDIPPPLIILGPADQTLAEHNTAMLPCDAAGIPQPSLRWLLNNHSIPLNNERFTVLDTGTLQIEGNLFLLYLIFIMLIATSCNYVCMFNILDLQLTDSGEYQCVVYSENGQSSWSSMLRIVSAHTTNTMFHQMPDPSTFPDAPSRPSIINVTTTSVTISWRRIGRDGASPFIGAILEYFSPDHHNEWIRVPQRYVGDICTIDGLKSGSRYFFLVRAQNSHGIGPPSPISYEARTELGKETNVPFSNNLVDLMEARRKLEAVIVELKEVRAINSSVVKLFWEVKGNQEYVEGFYVRYRIVDSESLTIASVSEHQYQMVTVYNGGASTFVLSNLPKYSIFEFFLVPFYKSVDGKPSNTRIVRTLEDIPSGPPTLIKAKSISSSSALVSWHPPMADQVNGLLLGYKLFVQGSYVPYNINLTISANTTSYLLRNLTSETEYVIQMLAFTSAGDGPSSEQLTFIIDPFLSSDVYSEKSSYDSSYMFNVWISVLIISLIILSLIIMLLGFLLYKKRTSILKKASPNLSINREGKHIPNSSLYASQWEYSWKTNSRESKPMIMNNSLKISSSFHPSEQNGYSTVTTDEQAADYAEVSQTDNNYETAYYGSSNDSPVAYASSNIIPKNQFNTVNQGWSNQSWVTQLSNKSKHPFSTIDRNAINHLYIADNRNKKINDSCNSNSFGKNSQVLSMHSQQIQPLIGANDYEDASLFYADSSAYNANVTQIPSSKLVANQFKYGSLSRVSNNKHISSQLQLNSMISNEMKASFLSEDYGKVSVNCLISITDL